MPPCPGSPQLVSSEPVAHGGDLAAARRRYGARDTDADQGWIDLSTGINPVPYPIPEISADAWMRLPGFRETRAYMAAAAACYGASEGAILPVPGAQSGIAALGRALASHSGPKVYLAPTYGEYARCFPDAAPVSDLFSIRRALDAGGVAIICNPNNPDGRALAAGEVLALADRAERRAGWLIVDESFADIAPDITACSRAGRGGLIVLRSFGKFYGLAGLRLGALLGPPRLLSAVEKDLGPWAVSGPALEIGRVALLDEAWAKDARNRIRSDARWLSDRLDRAGYRVIGRAGLFTLIQLDDARAWHVHLAKHGIWTRIFKDHPNWLRMGMPGLSENDWRRLSTALELGDDG